MVGRMARQLLCGRGLAWRAWLPLLLPALTRRPLSRRKAALVARLLVRRPLLQIELLVGRRRSSFLSLWLGALRALWRWRALLCHRLRGVVVAHPCPLVGALERPRDRVAPALGAVR